MLFVLSSLLSSFFLTPIFFFKVMTKSYKFTKKVKTEQYYSEIDQLKKYIIYGIKKNNLNSTMLQSSYKSLIKDK